MSIANLPQNYHYCDRMIAGLPVVKYINPKTSQALEGTFLFLPKGASSLTANVNDMETPQYTFQDLEGLSEKDFVEINSFMNTEIDNSQYSGFVLTDDAKKDLLTFQEQHQIALDININIDHIDITEQYRAKNLASRRFHRHFNHLLGSLSKAIFTNKVSEWTQDEEESLIEVNRYLGQQFHHDFLMEQCNVLLTLQGTSTLFIEKTVFENLKHTQSPYLRGRRSGDGIIFNLSTEGYQALNQENQIIETPPNLMLIFRGGDNGLFHSGPGASKNNEKRIAMVCRAYTD